MVINQLLPPNETYDFTVVRYMNLAKFLAFIANSELFFPTWEQLKTDDPHEGELNQKDIDIIINNFFNSEDNNQDYNLRNILINYEKTIRNIIVGSLAINCWSIVEFDCYAMWKLYAELEYGIAVTTTYSKLKNAIDNFDRPCVINRVIYRSPQEQTIDTHESFNELQMAYNNIQPYLNYFNDPQEYVQSPESQKIEQLSVDFSNKALNFYTSLIFSKRKAFEYENELRIATMITLKDFWLNNNQKLNGLKFPINLNYLIDNIYISPNAPDWLRNTIKKILHQFGIEKEVYISNLLTPPVHV